MPNSKCNRMHEIAERAGFWRSAVKMKRRRGQMTRREISRLAMLGALAGSRGLAPRALAQKAAARTAPVTDYVARFIVNTRYEDIPGDVLDLARKSILDG